MRKMKLPGDTTALTEMRRSLARFMLYEVPNKETYTAGKYQLTRVKKPYPIARLWTGVGWVTAIPAREWMQGKRHRADSQEQL